MWVCVFFPLSNICYLAVSEQVWCKKIVFIILILLIFAVSFSFRKKGRATPIPKSSRSLRCVDAHVQEFDIHVLTIIFPHLTELK